MYKVRIKCTCEVVVGFAVVAVLCVNTSISQLGSDGLG